jgi:hypothetical protein
MSKTPYDALYLGTNFEPFNTLYFRTDGVGKYHMHERFYL